MGRVVESARSAGGDACRRWRVGSRAGSPTVRRPPRSRESCCALWGLTWSRDEACCHFFITGGTGTGKTARAIVPIVHGLRATCRTPGFSPSTPRARCGNRSPRWPGRSGRRTTSGSFAFAHPAIAPIGWLPPLRLNLTGRPAGAVGDLRENPRGYRHGCWSARRACLFQRNGAGHHFAQYAGAGCGGPRRHPRQHLRCRLRLCAHQGTRDRPQRNSQAHFRRFRTAPPGRHYPAGLLCRLRPAAAGAESRARFTR
jgi:hypothetical protein